jgi:hypothetical protein
MPVMGGRDLDLRVESGPPGMGPPWWHVWAEGNH